MKAITRKQYKRLKKMDHNDINQYLTNFYALAYQDGVESVKTPADAEIMDKLMRIKGVGKKTAELILKGLKEQKNTSIQENLKG